MFEADMGISDAFWNASDTYRAHLGPCRHILGHPIRPKVAIC